jgi:hypothetical protein
MQNEDEPKRRNKNDGHQLKTSKVGIWKTINVGFIKRGKNETLVHSAFEIVFDEDTGKLMPASGPEGMLHRLVSPKGNIRMAMPGEI